MTTERDTYQLDTGDSAANVAALTARVTELEKKLEDAGKKSKQSAGELDYFQQIVKDAQSSFIAATAGFQLLSAGIRSVVEFLKEGVQGALAQEAAQMRLSTSLKMAGDSSGKYTSALIEQAESLEALTGTQAEHVEAIQALLAQMGIAPREIERMTNASLRLAAATGQDGVAAARLLARANAEGKDELARYGIYVDAAAFKAKGFASVLEQVETQFAPLEDTIPEQVKQTNALAAAWDDFSKAVGSFILNATQGNGLITTLTESLKGVSMIVGVVSASFNQLAMGMNSLVWAGRNLATMNYVDAFMDAQDAAQHFGQAVQQADNKLNELLSPKVNLNNKNVIRLPTIELHIPSKEEIKQAMEAAKRAKEEAEKLFVNSPSNLQAQERRDEAKARDEANKATRDAIAAQGNWEVAEAQYTADEKKAIADAEIAYQEQRAMEATEIQLQQAARTREIWNGVKQDLRGYAQQAAQALGQFFGEMIASTSQFSQKSAELTAKRELVAQGETEANITRAQVEKQMAQDRAASFLKMTADMLGQIAIQAAVKALWEGGEAIAAFASYRPVEGAQHLAAAGVYAGVAVLAGGTAMAINAARPMTSDEQKQLDSMEGGDSSKSTKGVGDTGAAATPAAPDKGTTVNVYNLGITGQTKEAQGAALNEIYNSYSDLRTGSR